ncbi:MAG: bifunctional pyr operon transcriptional regulator/uracil phosphoribosyltransferase PyrR [Deltaproteobacteria bacterium]|nr:bifunctional pyr operon transcriptional regulator/uracil phosphoribosyltransferase PyrR [Deltaproteobacteria bacterium]
MADSEVKILLGPEELNDVLDRLAGELSSGHNGNNHLVLVGIRTGGAILAQRLKERLDQKLSADIPCGIIDINLYRDDWTHAATHPRVGKTEISFSIDGKDVVLVDDVLYTGRTVRAALDAVIDLGRPRRIELLVMVDRGHRELPICADFVGLTAETMRDDLVNVHLKEHSGRDEVSLTPGTRVDA